MENKNQTGEVIDLRVLFRHVMARKWRIMGIVLATGIIASILIVLVPRSFSTKVMLAPESESFSSGGMLSSIGASFGLDLSSMQSSDAIYPLLYPDLIESNDFIVNLFSVQVETIDGSLKTNYYDYLSSHQKHAPWDPVIKGIRKVLKFRPKKTVRPVVAGPDAGPNPFMLTEREYSIAKLVKDYVTCTVDRKTDVITISVRDQDPMICANLADSIRIMLQDFITTYRTGKSRADMEYYGRLAEEAGQEYNEAMTAYSDFCDRHQNITMQSFISERDRLENEMQIKYNTYSAMNTQYQAARAKVQERTPVFTILQNTSVPVKPDKPKRMLFVLGMMFLACTASVLYYIKDDIFVNSSNTTSETLA